MSFLSGFIFGILFLLGLVALALYYSENIRQRKEREKQAKIKEKEEKDARIETSIKSKQKAKEEQEKKLKQESEKERKKQGALAKEYYKSCLLPHNRRPHMLDCELGLEEEEKRQSKFKQDLIAASFQIGWLWGSFSFKNNKCLESNRLFDEVKKKYKSSDCIRNGLCLLFEVNFPQEMKEFTCNDEFIREGFIEYLYLEGIDRNSTINEILPTLLSHINPQLGSFRKSKFYADFKKILPTIDVDINNQVERNQFYQDIDKEIINTKGYIKYRKNGGNSGVIGLKIGADVGFTTLGGLKHR